VKGTDSIIVKCPRCGTLKNMLGVSELKCLCGTVITRPAPRMGDTLKAAELDGAGLIYYRERGRL
jgi:hypothetical protein